MNIDHINRSRSGEKGAHGSSMIRMQCDHFGAFGWQKPVHGDLPGGISNHLCESGGGYNQLSTLRIYRNYQGVSPTIISLERDESACVK